MAASGYAALSEAHCVGVLGNYGASGLVTGVDQYKTTCPTGTSYLRGRVSAKSGTGTVALQITNGAVSVNTSDNTITAGTQCDGLNNESIVNGAGAFVSRNAGAAQYTLTVSSTTKPANYAMEFHCMNAAGNELAPNQPPIAGCTSSGTDMVRCINQ